MYLSTDSALLRAVALIVAIASAQAQSTPNVFNISRIEPPYITGKEASRLIVWVDVSTSDADSCTSVKIGNILQGLSCSRLDSTSFAVAVSADIHSYALDCAYSSSQIGGWSTYASLEIRAGQYVFSSSSANLLEVRFPSTVKAPPSSLQLFVLSLSAVMKILLCASGGAFLSHLGLLDAATASKIGKITTTMLLPALLFCSLSESMTLDAFSRLWFLPVSCIFYILFATAAAFLCGWAMRLPPTIRAVAAGCAGFGNAQGFPLVLISTIAEKLYDAEKQQLGLAYLSVYLIAHSSLLWGLAPMVVRSRVKQPFNPESSEADNIPMVQTDAQAPHSPDTSLAAPDRDHHEDHHEGAMGTSDGGHDYVSSQRIRAAVRRASALAESSAHDCMKYANKVADAIPPPVRGVLLGMFVGSVPFLRSWFVAKDGWANFAWKAADMLGKAAVPFSTMMMGVNVYFSLKVLFKVGFKASGLSSMTKPIIIAVLVRYLLLPIFGRLLLALGVALQLMPSTREDPIFSLMILLQSFTPSANNIILVVDAGTCPHLLSPAFLLPFCPTISAVATPSPLTRDAAPECRSHDGTPDATAKSATTYCQLSQYVLAPFAISILTALSLDFIQNA
jgi:auxin efflux carrier family protein